MTSVTELELPWFEYLNPELKGERFHGSSSCGSRVARLDAPRIRVLDREAGEFFLRSRGFTFPGIKIAEIFGIDDGPLYEEIRRNILHISGRSQPAAADS